MAYSAQLKEAERRQDARTVVEGSKEGDGPDFQCGSYEEHQEIRDFVRAVYGGTRTMRKSEDILPKHPAESWGSDPQGENYKRRVKRTTAYNGLARTVEGLVGMVFRKDPQLSEDVPDAIRTDAEDIDQQGNALPVFAKQVAESAMVDGHSFIHVEAPDGSQMEGVKSKRDTRAAGVRPYWLEITAERVINWRYHMQGGKPVTELLVYTESTSEPKGKYGSVKVEKFRVLTPGRFEVWRRGKTGWLLDAEGETGINYVPIVPVYAKKTGIFESMPPLLDLAYEQVDHFQVRSDYRTAMTFSAVSVVAILGAKAKNIKWGSNFTLTLEDPGADAKILESAGNGLGHMRQELLDTQERMASLGLEMLVRGQQDRTAREAGIKQAESTSALSTFAVAIEDALNQCLQIHADYRNADSGGTVTVNRDFEAQTMDPQTFQQLREAAATGQLSLFTLWERMVAGELLPDNFDSEQEMDRLANQSAVMLDAEAEVLERQRGEVEREAA